MAREEFGREFVQRAPALQVREACPEAGEQFAVVHAGLYQRRRQVVKLPVAGIAEHQALLVIEHHDRGVERLDGCGQMRTCLQHFEFTGLAFGDVRQRVRHAAPCPSLVPKRKTPRAIPAPVAAAMSHAIFHVQRNLALQMALERREHQRAVVRMQARFVGGEVVAVLVLRVPEQGLVARRVVDLVGHEIPVPHAVTRSAQRKFEALGGFAQRMLDLLQMRHVVKGPDDADHPPLGIAQPQLVRVVPVHGPVDVDPLAQCIVFRQVAVDDGLVVPPDGVRRRRVEKVAIGQPDDGAESVVMQKGPVGAEVASVGALPEHADRQHFEHGVQQTLAGRLPHFGQMLTRDVAGRAQHPRCTTICIANGDAGRDAPPVPFAGDGAHAMHLLETGRPAAQQFTQGGVERRQFVRVQACSPVGERQRRGGPADGGRETGGHTGAMEFESIAARHPFDHACAVSAARTASSSTRRSRACCHASPTNSGASETAIMPP